MALNGIQNWIGSRMGVEWSGICSDVDLRPISCFKEGAVSEGEALNLLVDLCFGPNPWSQTVGSDQKRTGSQIQNEFPLQVARSQP